MKKQRYFEFVRGRSKKFWSVAWEGTLVTVRFGRIGTDGQVKHRRSPTEVEAKLQAEGLARGKLAKGYREKKPPAKAAARTAARGGAAGFAALEASLVPETSFGADERRRKLGPGWEKKVRKATGLARLPPSYIEYAARLRGVGEWVVRRKQKRLPTCLEVRIKPSSFDHERKLLVTVLDMAAEYNQAELAAKWRHLVVFGTDTSRCFFCWDPSRIDRRGEPAIVLLDNYGVVKVTTIAKDLYELLGSYRQRREADAG